ncbi:MAG: DHA2 family efflux MFS transporter permease subunit [Terriglobales bacterium]
MPQDDQVVNPWMIALAVILPTFMEVLDTSIASVALPHIAGSVSATVDEATWVLTSYLVANAIVLPASSWFSLRFGRKRFLITCIVIFTISSFMCGASTSLGMILIARAVQGAGGGALQPLSQAILLESFPPQKRGLAMAMFGLGVVVAPVLGPTLGGWLTDTYSWRWAFYINIPVGVIAIMMIMRYVHDPIYIVRARPGRMDKIGFGLLAIWLAILQIILDKGQEDDWFSATWIRWASVVLIVSFVAFVIWEWNKHQPLVNLRVFRERNFALGCLLIALFGGVIYGLVTLLPLFYQELLGYPALNSGIAVSPRGLGAIIAMPLIGILTTRIDTRWLIASGFTIFALCSIWFSHINLGISQWTLTWAIILSGFGSGCVFVPLSTAAMARLPNEQIGNASGLYNLLRNIGGGIGISMINTVLARHEQIHRADLAHNISPDNPLFRQHLSGLASYLQQVPTQSLHLPTQQALELLDRTLSQQASLLSFVDDFRYLALVCALCVPIVFFMKKSKARKGAVSAAH